ncbi:MAG: zinc metallopeptidase [Chloroflexi bacterium]|nr:zinc metallopeptidase [Chloroflexota bacterium]
MLTMLLLSSTVMVSCGLIARWRLGHCLQDPQEVNPSLYEWLARAAFQYGYTVIFRPGLALDAGFVSGKKCLVLPEIPAYHCRPAPSLVDLAMIIHEIGHARQLYEASWLWRFWGYCVTWGQIGALVGWAGIFAGLFFPGLAASPFWLLITITGWGIAQISTLLRIALEWNASHKGLQMMRQGDLLQEIAAGAGLYRILRLAAFTYLLWPVTLEEFWHRSLCRLAAAVAGD